MTSRAAADLRRPADAVVLVKKARGSGFEHGVVADNVFLPGLQKLRILRDSGFIGRSERRWVDVPALEC